MHDEKAELCGCQSHVLCKVQLSETILATFCLFVFQNSVTFADLPRTEKKICEVEEL